MQYEHTKQWKRLILRLTKVATTLVQKHDPLSSLSVSSFNSVNSDNKTWINDDVS